MLFLAACVLTVIIETVFSHSLGFRDGYSVKIIALSNIATNLSLNLLIFCLPFMGRIPSVLVPEIGVVCAECFIYSRAFGFSKKLLLLTFAANLLSYSAGLLIFG